MNYDSKPVFTTIFKNESESPVRVLEDGKLFFRLAPGQTVTKYAIDGGKTYAPFAKVTFTKKGEFEVEKNKAWNPPEYWKDCPITEFINLAGAEVESLRIDGELCEVYRAVPRYWPIHRLNNPYALVARVEWQERTREVPDPLLGNMYLKTLRETVMVKTPRPKREIESIQKRIQEEAEARAKKESEARMKKLLEATK